VMASATAMTMTMMSRIFMGNLLVPEGPTLDFSPRMSLTLGYKVPAS
jgi:hypothetical protein